MMNTIFQLRPLQHQAEQKLIYNDPRVKKSLIPLFLLFMKTFKSLSTLQSESTAEPKVPKHQLSNMRFCFRCLSIKNGDANSMLATVTLEVIFVSINSN